MICTWINKLFDVIGYTINLALWQKKSSKDAPFVALFHPRFKSAAGKNKLNIICFLLKFAFNFLADLRVQIRCCGWKSLKLSVTGWTKRTTINCNCFLYGACVNPGSMKVFARNTGKEDKWKIIVVVWWRCVVIRDMSTSAGWRDVLYPSP